MALTKIKDYYPDYKDRVFGGEDVIGYSVYNDKEEKLGEVKEMLVDEEGRFRYFVLEMGFWIFGKKVLLPIGRTRMDFARNRVYATGLAQEQAEALPEYHEDRPVDYEYEEQVRGTYRPTTTGATGAMGTTAATGAMGATAGTPTTPIADTDVMGATTGTPIADTTDTEAMGTTAGTPTTRPNYTREDYSYDYDQDLYGMNEENHQKLKLYEERLVADKDRYKAGEVALGKKVETETAQVSVPVEKERVVIERRTPTNTAATPGTADFREGEVARMEVYEEEAQVGKEAFVREEVSIRKEVEQETVSTQEQVRREELDVDVDGKPNIGNV